MEPDSEPLPTQMLPKRLRVLIVEDNYILAANLQEELECLGYDVPETAASVEEAVRKAVNLRPHIVLMDIRLEDEGDGIQAATFIWNQLQIPIIFLTGHSDKSTVIRAQKTFPFGYILKPANVQDLHVAIATALDCW